MNKTLTIIITILLATNAYAQSNFGKIQGKVTDQKTKAPIAYATIMLEREGIRKGGAYTDEEGKYSINALDPGIYKITVKYIDYGDKVVTDIEVSSNSTKFLNIEMGQTEEGAADIGPVVIRAGKPLIEKDKNQTTLTSSDITKLPTRNLNVIAATSSAVNQTSGGLSFIGSRTDGTAYFVDGVRVVGSTSVPQAAQGQIDIIQSGIPAQYGDFTGGAISITTKGPSRYKSRSFEMISSSPFDKYNYNQIEFSSVGPLWLKNKGGGDKEYVALGYQLAANLNYTGDESPGYGGFYVVNDEKLAEIEANPLTANPNGNGLIPSSSLLRSSDLVKEQARRNVANIFGNFQGKLEFQPNKTSTISLFGSYSGDQGNSFQYSQSLMNYKENALSTNQTLRTYLKFTQRLGDKNEDDKEAEKSLFSGAFYTIRVDYQSSWNETQNPTHQDNIFDYGYLGKFTSYRQPFYQYVDEPTWHIDQKGDTVRRSGYYNLAGFFNSEITFEASDKNEYRANYTKNFFDNAAATGQTVFSDIQIQQGLGLLNGFNAGSTYSLWSNPGTVSYFYSKSQYERAAAYAQGEATLNLDNAHDLQFGMYYEQTFSSRWAIGANQLWTLMPQLANRHLSNLETVTENGYVIGGIHSYDEFGTFTDSVSYNIRIDSDQQSTFDKNLRAKLIADGATDVYGNLYNESSYIDINSLSPSDFSINMFSADDLWNNGNTYIAYNGYDYLGKRTRKAFGLTDFTNDSLNRNLGSFSPVYNAVWFQDKFQFKDLILRLGVRVERYDANQPVLKDDYSLFPTNSVAEARSIASAGSGRGANLLNNYDIPASIGDDYVVYVDNIDNPNKILGYRDGARWYDAEGTELANPDILAQSSNSGRIQPFLVSEKEQIIDEAFQDYSPVINVLPRVWFSFPINSEAQFFANYDVLAQRPTDGAVFAPANQYYFLEANQGGGLSNAALKPRLTTNYEIGFKQTLSLNSALSLIASYRESRGDFALVRVNQAYPISYNSYSNIDFSTVKNFRVEYELRGKGRTSMALNYALLFSDGTGSNINSSAALIQANLPNLRSLYPTEYDVRHKFVARFDYRFKAGKDYTGPIWFNKKIFSDAGANFIITTKSGEPYSAYLNPAASVSVGSAQRQSLDGNPYGSRKPWQFKADATFSKDFSLKKGHTKDAYRRNNVDVQVYLWVQNLFNNQVVNGLYGYTGLPNDDGWLSSPQGQQQAQNELNTQSYIDLYNAKVDYAYNYGIPRITRLGVRFYF